MKIFLLADTHGSYHAVELLAKVHDKFVLDCVVHVGDFSNFGDFYQLFFDRISELGISLFFVSGNHESRGLCCKLEEKYGAHYLDYRNLVYRNVLFAGIAGYDLFSPTRRRSIRKFGKAVSKLEADFSILLSHEPVYPWEYKGKSLGSVPIREILNGFGFSLVVVGHLHEKKWLWRNVEGLDIVNPSSKGVLLEIEGQDYRLMDFE